MRRVAGCRRPAAVPQQRADQPLIARAANTPLPSSIDYTPKLLPVRDQGDTPMCVAYASAAMKEYQDQPGVYLDPSDLYAQRADKSIEGMELQEAMQILQRRGIAPHPPNHRIGQYTFILGNINAVKQALVSLGVMVVALPYNPSAKGDQFWAGANSADQVGHCVAIVGYDDSRQALKLRNSWGAQWGEQGYAWMPYSDFVNCAWASYSATDQDGKSDPEQPQPAASGCCSMI